MKICPVAVAVGCRRCPIFKVCPAKSLIGDQVPATIAPPAPAVRKRSAAKRPEAAGKGKPRSRAR